MNEDRPQSPWISAEERNQVRLDKRDAILRTSAQLFNERGFRASSLTEVAKRLGITKPAIYYYFSNKDEILFECVRIGLNRLTEAVSDGHLAPGNGRQRLKTFLQRYAELSTDVFGICVHTTSDHELNEDSRRKFRALKRETDQALRAMIGAAVDDRSLAVADVRLASFTIAGAFNWMPRWYRQGGAMSAQQIGEAMVDLLMQGMSPADLSKRHLCKDQKATAAPTVSRPSPKKEPAEMTDKSVRLLHPKLLALVMAAGFFEGIDLQSMGVTLPKLIPHFGLTLAQAGFAASASLIGLTIGAVMGGAASDRIGRRKVLMLSLAAIGIFSFGTTLAWDYQSLLVARFLAGLGMGGVLPVLMAVAAESASERFRATALSLMFASGPLGAALAAILSATVADWRVVFWIGAIGPIVLVFAAGSLMERHVPGRVSKDRANSMGQALFAENRGPSTVQLWIAAFFTIIVTYLLMNWLPAMLIEKGFSRASSYVATALLALGSITGNLISGQMIDTGRVRLAVVGSYMGIGCSLAILAFSDVPLLIMVAVFLSGTFTTGAQLVIWALAIRYYPIAVRGTGIGALVAAGRSGSIVGPIFAGQMLHFGFAPGTVLASMVPGIILAMTLVLLLSRKLVIGERAG